MANEDNAGVDEARLKRLHYTHLRRSEIAACLELWLAVPAAQRFTVIFKATPQKDGTHRIEVFRGRRVWQ